MVCGAFSAARKAVVGPFDIPVSQAGLFLDESISNVSARGTVATGGYFIG